MQDELLSLLASNTEVLKKHSELIEKLVDRIERIEARQNANTCSICKKIAQDKSLCSNVCEQCFQKL